MTALTGSKILWVKLISDLSWSSHISNPFCVSKPDSLLDYFTVIFISMQTLLLCSNCTNHLFGHIWNTVQLFGILTFLRMLRPWEKVLQRFALSMCLKNWSLDHEQLYLLSLLPPLTHRQSNAKLEQCHLFKIVNELCDFPDAPIQQREIVYGNRQENSLQLTSMQARTNQFHNSFFPKTISVWSSLGAFLPSVISLPKLRPQTCLSIQRT